MTEPAAPPNGLRAWRGRVAITGVGLVTPVGLTAPAAAAAMRAGICRIGVLDDYEIESDEPEGEPASGARVPLAVKDFSEDRLDALAVPAIEEALRSAGLVPPPRGTVWSVLVGAAVQPRAGRELDQGPSLAGAVGRAVSRLGVPGSVAVRCEGRAAFLLALREGAGSLTTRQCDAVLAGSVDCWSDPLSLEHLDHEGRLRSAERPSGVLPGEAAGFVVLERTEDARRRGAPVLAELAAAAGAADATAPGEPILGLALSAVLRDVRSASDPATPLVVSDLNGERHRAYEWMFALSRGSLPHEGDLPHWYPASHVGDTGAASGAVGVGWAAIALRDGTAPARQAIVWGASDEGAREAVLLSVATEGAA